MIQIEKNLPVKVGCLIVEDIRVTKDITPYSHLLETAQKYRESYSDYSPGKVPGTEEARLLFKAIGLDPTKRRPASESLLRRAIKNKKFFKINTLVDIGNWCSLEFLLPICVYDFDQITGSVKILKGSKDHAYPALNGELINFENRFVLIDDKGAFGSPMTDSRRTAIKLGTTTTFAIIYAHSRYPDGKMQKHLKFLSERIIKYCDGELKYKSIFRN